eukprot:CAMPEP_0177610198 /NCGR_PEP_ID=MMETSP0419_2-20121207/19625_1 /TAXON_ID=582737 /ORGANISM="Tetraselmis sp., Strain GSL018" /LENGTH=935 /DNA_ID=CAMNT_0019105435 /DNA_START=222 /DNA_END=3029 /DNA_ORIENTATION=-
MAIDFGSENIRVSLVNSNRRPIQVEVVNNEISKRKTSAVVGFANGERLLGEAAASVDGKFRQTVFARARDVLGRNVSDPWVKGLLKRNYFPYELIDDSQTGTIRFSVGDDKSFSAEEIVASLLHYAHRISQAQFGGEFQDCVIVIPPFFGMRQRQAILDAAALAGLNVISLIHSHSGAALQYGIERDFSNNTELVVFYDMGAGSVEVSLAKFSSVNKLKKFQQFEVLDVAWDHELGSADLDLVLTEHFAAEFEEKHGHNIRSHPKVISKLRKAVRKTKEILSANKLAPVHCEELYDGIDFSSTITREKFEELATGFFARVAEPLTRVLERNGLSPEDVANIELIGGGVRVPKLQETLMAALNGRQLSRHFTDTDEAVVLGSGLYAANYSSSFRLRPFGMVDCAPYSLSLDIVSEGVLAAAESDAEDEASADDVSKVETSKKTIHLLPFRKKLPVKRAVKLGKVAGDAVDMTLYYNVSEVVPPGVDDLRLGHFRVSGISESTKKYNKTGKVTVHFAVAASGMVSVERAESVFDVVEYVEVEVPVKEEEEDKAEAGEGKADGSNGTAAGGAAGAASSEGEKAAADGGAEDAEAPDGATGDGAGDGAGQDAAQTAAKDESEPPAQDGGEAAAEDAKNTTEGGAGAANKTEDATKKAKKKPRMEKVKKQRKRTIRMPLTVTGGLDFGLSAEQLRDSRAVLKALADKDEEKRQTEAAKNELESFIIEVGSVLSDEAMEQVSTEAAREELMSKATELEDWLYEEGENEVAATYRGKLAELHALLDPISMRAAELEARPAAVQTVSMAIEEHSKEVADWEESRPWLNETQRLGLLEEFGSLASWLVERTKEQDAKAPHEDPAFTSDELLARLAEVEKSFNKLKAKKPPKPPKQPQNATAAENATSAENATAAGNETGSEPGPEAEAAAGGEEATEGEGHDEL